MTDSFGIIGIFQKKARLFQQKRATKSRSLNSSRSIEFATVKSEKLARHHELSLLVIGLPLQDG